MNFLKKLFGTTKEKQQSTQPQLEEKQTDALAELLWQKYEEGAFYVKVTPNNDSMGWDVFIESLYQDGDMFKVSFVLSRLYVGKGDSVHNVHFWDKPFDGQLSADVRHTLHKIAHTQREVEQSELLAGLESNLRKL